MKPSITVLGTGTVGRTLAVAMAAKGYQVVIGTRNPDETLKKEGAGSFSEWYKPHNHFKLMIFENAIKESDIIINALNGNHTIGALKSCDSNDFAGKLLIDISNPLDFSKGFPPTLLDGLNNGSSLGETIQALLPESKVVKTLNTMWCGLMLNPQLLNSDQHLNFISGNDAQAKEQVISLLQEFGWKKEQFLDLGDITASRGTEGYLLLWTRMYATTKNGAFNISLVKSV